MLYGFYILEEGDIHIWMWQLLKMCHTVEELVKFIQHNQIFDIGDKVMVY